MADRPVERRVVDHRAPRLDQCPHASQFRRLMVARTLDAWRLTSPTCGSPSPTCRSRRARGAGSPRPTASSTSTSPRASRSRPPATATRRCRPRSQQQAQRFIHAQVNCYHHDLLEPLADRLAEITPGEHRHVLLRELGCGDHRSRGEARQAGDGPAARDRVLRQLPRAHAPDDGDDDVEGGLPRRARAAAAGHLRRAVPRSARARHRRRDRPRARRARPPARRADRTGRDRGDDHRAGARRRRLRARAARGSCKGSRPGARSTASCSSPTRCSPGSGARARCSR